MTRPTKDEYFFGIVQAVAARGTCSRRRVGAIAVREDRILGTGYNGAVEWARHCDHDAYAEAPGDDPDLHLVNGRASCHRATHAEMNILAYAARYGVALLGATIYCDTYPCYGCAKAMVSAGIREVKFASDYINDPRVAALCEETGLKVTRV